VETHPGLHHWECGQEPFLRKEYLSAENLILRAQLKRSLRSRTLSEPNSLTLVFGWVARSWPRWRPLNRSPSWPGTDGSAIAHSTEHRHIERRGRPPIDRDVEELIVRMANENRSWSYDRLIGALANLSYEISRQTTTVFWGVTVTPAPRSANVEPPGLNSFGPTSLSSLCLSEIQSQ
jgi:hypothetical protein